MVSSLFKLAIARLVDREDRGGRVEIGAYLFPLPFCVCKRIRVGIGRLVHTGRRRGLIVRRRHVFGRW